MINWSQPEKAEDVIGDLINEVRERLPVIDSVLERFDGKSLNDYYEELCSLKIQPLQGIEDLLEAATTYVAPILGEIVAQELARDLQKYPVVLTANHHGVDYFAQSFQGNLLFLAYRRKFTGRSAITPIFSCGGVPLSNSSYPKGILLYDAIQPDSGELPFKQPIYPNNFNQTMVYAAPRFNEEMVESALKQLDKTYRTTRISKRAFEAVRDILLEEYHDPLVLNQPDYSAQAMLLNNRLGKRIFADQKDLPEVIYVEFETLTALLLRKDLFNSDSLIYRIFFDTALRRKVISYLDTRKGCWDYEKLKGLINGKIPNDTAPHLLAGYGAVFFWGLDILGRRYPLLIIDNNGKEPFLTGIDGLGITHSIPFNPLSILAALNSKLICPSLFTMFTVVSLARGVTCVGGYFQSEYLPVIQKGLTQALNDFAEYRNYAEALSGVATHFYLSGMMFLLAGVRGRFATPAGPVEILSRGGIKTGLLDELGSLSISEAHQIGLFNIYPDIVSKKERLPQWQKVLAWELNKNNWERVLS